MIITINVDDLIKDLDKDLKKIEQGIEEGMLQVGAEIAQMQHDIIDASLNPNSTYVRTGLLKSGVTIMPLEWSSGLASMTITNTTSYAP